MEIYHWILLILFSLPYIGTKIYNDSRYNKNIYWLGMNKAELILATLPIILSTMTIRKYGFADFQYIAYMIAIFTCFIHSIRRYESVKAIIEEAELEPKIPEKKDPPKEITYDISQGGGGGYGYTDMHGRYTVYYDTSGYATQVKRHDNPYTDLSNDPKYTQVDMDKLYQSHEHAKTFILNSQSTIGVANNPIDKRITPIEASFKRITVPERPTVKLEYDDTLGYSGLIYNFENIKLKHVEDTDQWYFYDFERKAWTLICMNEDLLKLLYEEGE